MTDPTERAAILVRPVAEDDLPALWPLLAAMGFTEARELVLHRVAELRGQVAHYLPVAVIAGGVVGYAWAQDYGPHIRSGQRTARLHDLFVAPEHRRQGAGAHLLATVTTWAQERGVRWLQWQASVAALPFYARLGLAGDPCPDPGHPFFEIEFPSAGGLPRGRDEGAGAPGVDLPEEG